MIEENKAQRLAQIAMLQNALDDLQYFTELMDLVSKSTKIKYNSYINQGFTPEQAIYLCKD